MSQGHGVACTSQKETRDAAEATRLAHHSELHGARPTFPSESRDASLTAQARWYVESPMHVSKREFAANMKLLGLEVRFALYPGHCVPDRLAEEPPQDKRRVAR